jgi:cytochrome c oxidase cbb3-type subunit 2
VVPESIMPSYASLARTELRVDDLPGHLATLKRLGVPYTDAQINNASADARAQAQPGSDGAAAVAERYGKATGIGSFDGNPGVVTEMDALVAYLQILGRLTDLAHKTEAIGGIE